MMISMKHESAILIGALRRSVTGTEVKFPEEINWNLLLRLVGAHRVEALLYDGLKKTTEKWGQVPDEVQRYLTSAYMRAVYLDVQFEYIRGQLRQMLTQAGIKHIFLKGSVLRQNYPDPVLRSMCDIDVLVCTDDFPRINQIMKKISGEHIHSDGNHRTYTFSSGVIVEFHPNLLHQETPVGTQINPGWQYAATNEKTGVMELTPEGFYLNTICHLANHFAAGGVGVRFVLDVWVNRHLRKPAYDREFVRRELERFGLLEFERNIVALSEFWFGDGEETPLLAEMGAYILTSGSHGTDERAMLNAVSLSPGGSRSSALLKKAFYSRAEMEDRFPWVHGKPWLLPVAWFVRAFRAVTKHGHLILKWGKGTGDFTKEEIAAQKEKLKQFGIGSK